MSSDLLSAEERLRRVIALEVPDRVPTAPFIYHFAGTYAGVTSHELWSSRSRYDFAMEKTFAGVGPWDVYYPVNPVNPGAYLFVLPMKLRLPGIDLPAESIFQVVEEPLLSSGIYRQVTEDRRSGPMRRYIEFLLDIGCAARAKPRGGLAARLRGALPLLKQAVAWRAEFARWAARGVAVQHGLCLEAPFDTLSLSRGLTDFSYDLMGDPAAIGEAVLDLSEGFVAFADMVTRLTRVRRMLVFCHRTSNDFISPTHFRDYALPSLRRIVNGLVARGITPFLHCDGNWDRNLEHLRELPTGEVVLQFDGRTDIFRAKEVLGSQFCLLGDVPATMLAFGSQDEVETYCRKLIEKVGKDGGFILGAGCEVAPNARPENVKAMLASVHQYGRYS
ncbi:MAG: hypothetical protein HY899_00085 [Deltaproteobacteria bacterium]|nr:hypothetical protein [Deltaproteobacteria bacterium]